MHDMICDVFQIRLLVICCKKVLEAPLGFSGPNAPWLVIPWLVHGWFAHALCSAVGACLGLVWSLALLVLDLSWLALGL